MPIKSALSAAFGAPAFWLIDALEILLVAAAGALIRTERGIGYRMVSG